MNSKDYPPLHTPSESGFTAAVSDDPTIDSRLFAQMRDACGYRYGNNLGDAWRLKADPALVAAMDGSPADRLRFAQARGWTASLSDAEGARLLAGASR